MLRLALAAAAFALGLVAAPALAAGLPSVYDAVVVKPTGAPERAEFDLDAAVERAKREKKRLYVYLGADNCPFCRRYESFLARHAAELQPKFAADYVLVDLRSSLSFAASSVYLKAGGRSLPYAEFQAAIGDERSRLLVYPNVWVLDTALKPLIQMPSGTGTFQTVPEQLEILRLEQ